MKRQVEIFTAGCPVCEPVVKDVQEMACGSCEVRVYDLSKEEGVEKAKEYNIRSLPAVVVNGELLDCCKNKGVEKSELLAAGIGKN